MDSPGDSSSIEAMWDNLRTRLEQERGRIQQEIRSYPTPIAGCDQQFNALLEERSQIAAELLFALVGAALTECFVRHGGAREEEFLREAVRCVEGAVRPRPDLSERPEPDNPEPRSRA